MRISCSEAKRGCETLHAQHSEESRLEVVDGSDARRTRGWRRAKNAPRSSDRLARIRQHARGPCAIPLRRSRCRSRWPTPSNQTCLPGSAAEASGRAASEASHVWNGAVQGARTRATRQNAASRDSIGRRLTANRASVAPRPHASRRGSLEVFSRNSSRSSEHDAWRDQHKCPRGGGDSTQM